MMFCVALCTLAVAVAACARTPSTQRTADPGYSFVGVATLQESGTICLQMRSEQPGQPVAEGYFCYAPDHPEYADISEHIGPIKVGEEKTFGPFE